MNRDMSKYNDERGVLLAWVVVTVAIIFALFLIGTIWKFAPEVERLQAEQAEIDKEIEAMQSNMDEMLEGIK